MSLQTPVASVGDEEVDMSVYEDSPEQVAKDRRQLDAVREKTRGVVNGFGDWLEGVAECDASLVDSGSGGSDEGLSSTTAVAYAISGLQDLSRRVQRISRQNFASRFRKGRVAYCAERRGGPSRMKQYSLTGSRTLLDLENADGIYDELNAEQRVTCQITARTAIGKTTRFPAMIANRCKRRVLLVEPDVPLARYAADAQKGLVSVRVPWMKSRMPVLTVMSYDDFNGQFRGQNGLSMLDQFEVVIFDEAHVLDSKTMSAKTLAATYSKTASLLVCSATIDGNDVQATGKPVDVKYTSVSLRDLADKGHLMNGVCGKDRTLVIATDDREAQYVSEKISDGGYDVCVLDSASREEDISRASGFLEGDSAVVHRFLVVTPKYGLGYNFKTGNVVSSGQKVVHVMSDDGRSMEARRVVCSSSEIKQQIARGNRGMTSSASALICVLPDDIKEEVELTDSERLRYYVTMVASHVEPTGALTQSVKGLLPFGLTQRVAADLLAINLPIEVAIRFFADDGRVPFKYTSALSSFSEEGYDFMISDFDEPHGKEKWISEPMTEYYGESVANMPSIAVPCKSSGDVKVMLHSVCAAAMGLMVVEDWSPSFVDSDVSDDDIKPSSVREAVYRPRLVLDATPRKVYRPLPMPYAYNVPGDQQYAPRSRLAIHGDGMSSTMLSDLASWDVDIHKKNFDVNCELEEYKENGSDRIGIIKPRMPGTPIDIHSPGGSVVMAFRKVVWMKLVSGEALSPVDARSFFHSIKNNVEGFVASDAFSGWTDVWLAIFRTAANTANMNVVKENNYTARVLALLMALVIRYSTAVQEVSRSSVIKAGFLGTMLKTRKSYEEVYREQSSRGRAEIAQSETFLRRIFEIRDVMVNTLLSLEEQGVFAPAMVTQLQQMLPVMRTTGIRLIDKPTTSRFDRYIRLK